MTNITGINGNFFLWLATIVCGSVGLMIRFCYKSKCRNVDLCCLKVVRDIDVEQKTDIVRTNSSA